MEDVYQARILIVDDIPDSVALLEAMLRSEGYQHLTSTSDARQVLHLYRRVQPDLILLDLMMPYVDGFEVMAQLRPLLPPQSFTPILVLTGDISASTKRRALREGARDFVPKPFDQVEVMLRIRNLLEMRLLHSQLHGYNQRLLEMQEAERRHLAHELHDEVGQALTAVKINLQAGQKLADAPTLSAPTLNASTLSAHLEEGIGIVERALHQVRDLSLNLRPAMLDDFGLIETLSWYADRRARGLGMTTRFSVQVTASRFSPAVETACFRIAQEAMTNALKHAQAKRFEIELREHDQELELVLRDDGIGFDLPTVRQRIRRGTSLGVLCMEERARLIGGRLEIISQQHRGTEVRGYFPLAACTVSAACQG
ncbi:MAG: response regulator [Abitibacteriaceae bacterium]|nr:response regulator [Abditibacteriaceae bacterium]